MKKTIFYFLLVMGMVPASRGAAQTVKQAIENPKYPLIIEASVARQQAAEDAWNAFLSEYRLTFVKPELPAGWRFDEIPPLPRSSRLIDMIPAYFAETK